MAIVPQDMFVIRDTVKNEIMEGAKGQLAFSTTGVARRSLVHTGWWLNFKRYDTARKLMPLGNQKIDELEHLNALVQAEDWRNRDKRLAAARNDLNSEISQWMRGSKEYKEASNKVKFDNQTRYVVESLVLIETKEIK
jgi:hypothetical protein